MPDGQLFNENNLSFWSSLDDIERDSSTDIDPVKVLWTTILASWFPPSMYFTLIIKGNPSSDSITLTVEQLSENASKQVVKRPILMLVCKSLSNDSPTEWQESTDSNGPLVDSLEKIETDSLISRGTGMNNTADRRLYTALAIGAKAKFFRWSRGGAQQQQHQQQQQQQQFKELHSGILDLRTNDGRVDLEATLAEISRNGWDWAQ